MNQINSQIEQLTINREEQPTTTSSNRYLIVLITIIASSIIIFLLNQQTNAKQAHEEQISQAKPSPAISVGEIAQADNNKQQAPTSHQKVSNRVLDASGHIVARRIATVSSRVTGKITQLNIEEGQVVESNQILAELASTEASLEELQIAYLHELKLFKRRSLLAGNHVVSDEIVESSETKTKQMAAQIKNKKAQVDLAKQRLALAQYQLDQHKIRAPFDGVVIRKNAQVGELISAGSSGGGFIRTGVGTIVDMSSLEIEVEVGETYINRVYSGQKVEAKLDAYPSWKISSEVVAIIPTADRQKASIKVRVKLLESDPRILPDMSVKVSFMGES